MKAIEMDVLDALTMEGASTTDISRRVFGEIGEWKVKHERARVYSSLICLEDKGLAVSRMCRPESKAPKTLYWALPGGHFPEGEPSTKEMILSVLREQPNPVRMDVIIKGVYDEEELNRDYRNAMKRINKTLNHMKQQGLVQNCGEVLSGNIWLTCWQLVDKEADE